MHFVRFNFGNHNLGIISSICGLTYHKWVPEDSLLGGGRAQPHKYLELELQSPAVSEKWMDVW